MNTRSGLSFVAALVGLLGVTVGLPAQTTTAAVKAQKVTFEKSDTPVVIELPAPDPFLQEAKYAACFQAQAPMLLVELRGGVVGSPAYVLSAWVRSDCAEDLTEEAMAFLTTQVDRAVRVRFVPMPGQPGPSGNAPAGSPVPTGGWGPPPARGVYQEEERDVPPLGASVYPYPGASAMVEVQILAPSPEKAEQWGRAIISVYNTHCVKIWQHMQDDIKEKKREIEQFMPDVEQAQAKLKEAEKAIAQFSDIDKDAQAALRTKKWLLAVDLAGVEARVKEIEKMLEPTAAVGRSSPELATLQIAASVDLADLRARLKQTDLFLEEAAQRAKLAPTVHEARADVERLLGYRRMREEWITAEERQLSTWDLGPLRVEGGRVVMQPITWKIVPSVPQTGQPGGAPYGPGAPGSQ